MQATTSSISGESTSSLGKSIPYKDILGGVNEREGICKTVRASGRGDIHKKHSWDLVIN